MRPYRTIAWIGAIVAAVGCQASVSARGSAEGVAEGQGDPVAGGECPSAPADPAAPTTDRGASPKLGGSHDVHALAAGTYQGDLVVGGNHTSVCGAGRGKTIIEGALVLGGNHNRVEGITVRRRSKVGGNHNDASGCEFLDGVEVGGNHSQ